MFPGIQTDDLLLIPTCQNAAVDLIRLGDDVAQEKDRLLEVFVNWAKLVCDKLMARGYWCDYLDPAAGLPMIHKGPNNPYGEVEALGTLLGYSFANAGCCKVILHPKWGSSVYPASMFAKAPLEVLLEVIREVEADSTSPLSSSAEPSVANGKELSPSKREAKTSLELDEETAEPSIENSKDASPLASTKVEMATAGTTKTP
ncbi:hypothetical protein CBR_g61478 [Chara braunii]|uniref:Methylmalonic aciduria and homocystinuria type D protein n=1 Tax=Chara braunii TaxID=69332 RepID=A0A388K8R0_CHABU|nr:hypothetical protein CBR_g61478 [Chara braunii]|eukprot:GBG66435.1 hypothetical protein CBR_g61478 [Chara braunii]